MRQVLLDRRAERDDRAIVGAIFSRLPAIATFAGPPLVPGPLARLKRKMRGPDSGWIRCDTESLWRGTGGEGEQEGVEWRYVESRGRRRGAEL